MREERCYVQYSTREKICTIRNHLTNEIVSGIVRSEVYTRGGGAE